MAKQAGPLYLTGTIDDITFYKMEGEYYARKKSSLTGKQFRTDPRFARSRKSAASFGAASELASDIYWQLPKAQRGKGVVNKLTGKVGKLLREGKTPEEVTTILLQQRGVTTAVPQQPNPVKESPRKELVKPTLSGWRITPKCRLFISLADHSIFTQSTLLDGKWLKQGMIVAQME